MSEQKMSQQKKKSVEQAFNKETRQLAKSLRFSLKDLHYNRHGVVSREQHKRVTMSIRIWTIIYAVLFVLTGIIGIIGVMYLIEEGFSISSMIDGWYFFLFGVLAPIGLMIKLQGNLKAIKALNTGDAFQYRGAILKRKKEWTEDGEKRYEYTITLGNTGIEYELGELEYKVFKHGVEYIFYYIPQYKRFLTVEVVSRVPARPQRYQREF